MEEQSIKNTFVSMTEAGFSASFRMLDASGNEVQITMRGQAAADWNDVIKDRRAFLETAAKGGWSPVVLRQSQPQAASAAPQKTVTAAVVQQAGQPSQRPTADGSHTFHATKLKVEFSPQGKKVGKLCGGQFAKYGVTVWPEIALEQLGFDLEATEAGEYNFDMEVAYVLNPEGKPQKVIGRAGGRAPQSVAPQQAAHEAAGFGANDPETTPF